MSEKQATSIHIEAVKTGSEEHNRREKELSYVMKNRTHLNEYWQSDSQEQRLANIKSMVKEKTGRSMQKKATPIREGVVVIKPTTTMEDLQKYAAAIKQRFGIDCFQIAIHRDEGHRGKVNFHAHMVFDFMNHQTGRSIKIGREGAAELQTLAADTLDMERGISSDIEHLSAIQFKNQAEERRGKKLLLANAEQEEKTKKAKMEQEKAEKAAVSGAKVAAAHAVTAVAQAISSKIGLNKAQNELKDLKTKYPMEIKEKTSEAHEKGISEGYSMAVDDVMKAAKLKFGTKATPEMIGRSWKGAFMVKQNLEALLKAKGTEGERVLAKNIVKAVKNGWTNMSSRDHMTAVQKVRSDGTTYTEVKEIEFNRLDLKEMFNKLCEKEHAHQVNRTEDAIGRRKIIGMNIALHCLSELSTVEMQQVDQMLEAFANDYRLPKQEDQEEKREQIRKRDIQEGVGRHFGL